MNKNIMIAVGVLLLGGIVFGVYTSQNSKESIVLEIREEGKEVTQKEIDTMMKEDATLIGDGVDAGGTVVKAGSYEAYLPEKLSRADTGDVVLFFHASWCPSCRSLNSDIENNLGSIPEKVSILKVDYDKETELKKKYGITYQHTLVQVDKDGNLIKKWSGSPKLSSLVSQIQ